MGSLSRLAAGAIHTPAFVYDEGDLHKLAAAARSGARACSCRLLFSLKSFTLLNALRRIGEHVCGLSVSSLFEAKLARAVVGQNGTVHITTPGFRPDEINNTADLCDYISFNSLRQWRRSREATAEKASCGVRVNPQISFVEDERYDPCRKHSKLGVPLSQLVTTLATDAGSLDGIKGLHFHTNCDATSFVPLLKTVRHLDAHVPGLLGRVEWVNLGGGYLFDEANDLDPFYEAVGLLKRKYDVEVFVEPGAGIVRDACSLVSSVLDIFDSDGKMVVVLDTTVNHLPEVLEFGFRPDVTGDKADGKHRYILAGCTCLSGDVFGEYGFDDPLEVGSRVVFPYCGAYSQTKWNWFNGINLPSIYAATGEGPEKRLELKRRFCYEDYVARLRNDRNAADCSGNRDPGATEQ